MDSECAKNWAQVIALLAAAGFFLWKVAAGYFFPNLTVSVDCLRKRIPGSAKDFLKITVKLKKGEYGTLRIHDAQAKIIPENGQPKFVPLNAVDRRSSRSDTIGRKERKVINWEERSKQNPFINMSPKEETHFAAYVEAPQDVPCVVEIAILAKILGSWRFGQWRASCVSLPPKNPFT